MPAPTSASRHHRRLQRLQYLTVAAARRAWRRLELRGNWERQYREDVGPKIAAVVVAAQVAATRESDAYIADVLNELDFGPPTDPGVVIPNSLAGFTGDGRSVASLLATAVGRARASLSTQRGNPEAIVSNTLTPTTEQATKALGDAETFMDMVVQTILADSAREAELVAMAVRPWVDGWVRMINPPCCSRCAVLSGKFYLFNEGFLRHPRCDCYHAPAPSDGAARDRLMAINSPDRYFDSLTEEEQDRIFTKDGAEAIRLGADVSKVVNARRGMNTAGQTRTRAGSTAAGLPTRLNVSIRRAAPDSQGNLLTTEGITRRRDRGTRLMPETLAKVADGDREEFLHLLRLHGYLT